jgi:Ca-activated chloride channel family protein
MTTAPILLVSDFTFQWPLALVSLLLVPVLIGLYVWMQKRRRKYALSYASVALVRQAVGKGPGVRRHIPAALYITAIAAMLIALARPTATVPVPQNTGTVILSLDVSGSMLAEDVKPDRMEATKKAVRDFIKKQPHGVKVGVVAFSDFASLVAAPSTDKKQALEAVARLQPQRGTNIGAGLQIALDAINEQSDIGRSTSAGPPTAPSRIPTPTPVPKVTGSKPPAASIVLLSDGQSNTGPDPLKVAQEAVDAGIKVYTIGIGTPEGTILQIQGRNVFTQLDESTLKGVAEKTQARYFNAQDEASLGQIYDELTRERAFEDENTEITFAFAAIAGVLFLVAGGLGLLWFNRLP